MKMRSCIVFAALCVYFPFLRKS